MSKVNIKITFTLHDGSTLTADDTQTAGAGTLAYQDLVAERLITVKTESETNLVPYHAVVKAVVEKTTVADTTPEDANCNYKGC